MSRRTAIRLASSFLAAAAAAGPVQAQARFERISVSTSGVEANGSMGGGEAVVSADGRHVAWDSYASNLAPYDINNTLDVFVRDRVDGTTVLISTALTGLSGNSGSFLAGMSDDGRFVVFQSSAYDLVKYDTNRFTDVFVRDRDPDGNGDFDEGNETTVRVSVASDGAEANGSSSQASITADGRLVAFSSDASNLVAGDTNGTSDVFLHDLTTGVTQLISVSSQGVQGNGYSFEPQISRDGALVGFASTASNLVKNDKNNRQDAFIRDVAAGTTERVSVRTDGAEANGDAYDPSMSRDGERIVFWSYADDLVGGDTNNAADVFLHDRASGETTRLSLSASGAQPDRSSYNPHLSANGQFVVFGSDARNLAGIETNNAGDVFVVDLATAEMRKVSVHPSGKEGSGGSFGYGISDDGLIVAMIASGFDLIGSDANGTYDLLVRNRTLSDPLGSWRNYGAGWPGAQGVPALVADADPVLGTTLDVEVGNSVGFYAVGFVMIGLADLSAPTNLGGTLLVDPFVTQALLLEPASTVMTGAIPLDDGLLGISLYLQVLELDAAASRGVSFTPGLELILGQ